MTLSKTHLFVCEHPGEYRVASDDEVTAAAINYMACEISTENVMQTFSVTRNFIQLQIGKLDYEVFCVLFLDTHNRLLSFEQMFRGTVEQTMVYPREVARRALALNATNVVIAHNHPSGSTKPSPYDERLTRVLREALSLIDVTILDHVIASPSKTSSFLELGLL